MGTSYPNLYQKSILFEIINIKNPTEVVSAFTLTLPPDSMEVTQSQRVTRTKTFGGVFIDDYGLDVAKITISGTTGNSDVRSTYIPGKGESLEQYSGKTAIYALRDKIARYKTLLAGKGFESYEMRMYDLSTMPSSSTLDSVQATSTDGWVVSLDDFKISRSKDKPLWYNFSIELVGLCPLPSPRKKAEDEMDPIVSPTGDTDLSTMSDEMNTRLRTVKVPKSKDWLQDAISGMRRCVNAVRNAYSWSANIINQIDNVFALLDDLENLCVEYIQAAGNLLTEGFGFYSKIFDVAAFPGSVAVAAMQATNEVMQTIEDEMEYTESIPTILGDDYDYVVQLCEETKRIGARIVNFGKSSAADSEVTIEVNGASIVVYGTISVTADASTTLEKLATEYYGDPAMVELLATYNGITNEDIVPGMTLKMPQITRSSQVFDNKIYSWDRASSYGADISLASVPHSVAMIIAESGDFSYVSEKDNLFQAINLRLNETLGKRLRLTVYGLSCAIGAPKTNSAPIEYILSNLRDTLKQDPRVKSIEGIKLTGIGDSLYIACNIRAISDTVSYEGVL
jgi:hypothetical protein